MHLLIFFCNEYLKSCGAEQPCKHCKQAIKQSVNQAIKQAISESNGLASKLFLQPLPVSCCLMLSHMILGRNFVATGKIRSEEKRRKKREVEERSGRRENSEMKENELTHMEKECPGFSALLSCVGAKRKREQQSDQVELSCESSTVVDDFQTGNGKRIEVKKANLHKAQQKFQEDERAELAMPPSDSLPPLEMGFSTARGRQVTIKKESYQKVAHLFEDDKAEDIWARPQKRIAASKERSPHKEESPHDVFSNNFGLESQQVTNVMNGSFGDFSTARGKKVEIKEDSFKKIAHLFKEEDSDEVVSVSAAPEKSVTIARNNSSQTVQSPKPQDVQTASSNSNNYSSTSKRFSYPSRYIWFLGQF